MDNLQGKTFLITGGTGFLGWHLIKHVCSYFSFHSAFVLHSYQLVSLNAKARIFSRNMTPELNQLGSDVEHFPGSILDVDSLLEASKGVSGIFHLAGLVLHSRTQNTQEVYDVNVQGTLNVMEAAKMAKCRVVLASTSGTVGCSQDPNFVANDNSPYCRDIVKDWPYYDSKIDCEVQALAFSKEHNVPLVIIRPSSMYGPEDFYGRSTGTIKSFLSGKLPFIPPGGMSFLDIRDAAQAFSAAMQKGRNGETYLIGGKNCSLNDFFTDIEIISGVKKPSLSLSPWLVVKLANCIDWYNRKIKGSWDQSLDPVKAEMSTHWWNIDWSKATKELDYHPRDPMKTLEDTVTWLKENTLILKSKL